jgi:hypothetical protein
MPTPPARGHPVYLWALPINTPLDQPLWGCSNPLGLVFYALHRRLVYGRAIRHTTKGPPSLIYRFAVYKTGGAYKTGYQGATHISKEYALGLVFYAKTGG